jgi:hypothetical protein
LNTEYLLLLRIDLLPGIIIARLPHPSQRIFSCYINFHDRECRSYTHYTSVAP